MNVDEPQRLLRSFIGSRNGRDVFTFDVDADGPRYGSLHPSPLGLALCVFSDLPQSGNGLEEVLARLTAFHRGSGPRDAVPPYYGLVASWLGTRPHGWWVLSHHIDNDVLSINVPRSFEHSPARYLADLLDYQTVQTESRRLTFLSADRSSIVDMEWDSENFAVFFHASRTRIESFFDIEITDPTEFNRDASMMNEAARMCQWGGAQWSHWEDLDERYRLHPHEWRQLQGWLSQGVTSAAESMTGAENSARIDRLLDERENSGG